MYEPFKQIKDYVHNPLGIIAMFISLIYGFAVLLLGLAADKLTSNERMPIIIFIIIFPVLILVTFFLLVTKHHSKLYSPSDFRTDDSFWRILSPSDRNKKVEKEIDDNFRLEISTHPNIGNAILEKDKGTIQQDRATLLNEYLDIEDKVINKIERELNITARRHIRISSGFEVDAIFPGKMEITALEVKYLKSQAFSPSSVNSLLGKIANLEHFFQFGTLKLLIVIVYSFEQDKLLNIENNWRRIIKNSQSKIELRFIPKSELYELPKAIDCNN